MVFSTDNLFFLRLEKNHFLLHSTLKLASKMRTLDFGIFIAEKSTLSFIFQAVSRGNEGWPSKKIALKIFSALTKKLFSPLLLATKMLKRFTRQVDSKGCYLFLTQQGWVEILMITMVSSPWGLGPTLMHRTVGI